jgi:GWxTD domain-containing protein
MDGTSVRKSLRQCVSALFLCSLGWAHAGAQPELTPENVDALAFRWLREYVDYIITDREREAFLTLETPEERLAFMELFWKRRDPTPGTPENEAREEHMRRFSYANQHFGTGKPGWKTDRGRVYIMLGPPQSRSTTPMGRQMGERASEVWTYNGVRSRSLPQSFDLSFLDFNDTGDYQLVSNLDLAAPIRTSMGYIGSNLDLLSRAVRGDSLQGTEDANFGSQRWEYDNLVRGQLDLIEDLTAIREVAGTADQPRREVETRVQYYNFPIVVAPAYYRSGAGRTRALLSFSVDFSAMGSKEYRGLRYYHVELSSRLLRGGVDGPVVDELREDLPFQVPEAQRDEASRRPLVHQLTHFVEPGAYTLELLVRDAVSQRLSVTRRELLVPALGTESLQLSTVLLADSVRQAEGPALGGRFREGGLEVLPRVGGKFRPEETMYVYLQVYGAEREEDGAHRLQLDYRVWSDSGALVLRAPTQSSEGRLLGSVAVATALPLRQLKPGQYELELIVRDELTEARATQRVPFELRLPAP